MELSTAQALLGVTLGLELTPAAVERAYRKLALRWHPDKVHDGPAAKKRAEEHFKKIGNARELLLARARGDPPRPVAHPYWVYLIRRGVRSYVGATKALAKRTRRHLDGLGSGWLARGRSEFQQPIWKGVGTWPEALLEEQVWAVKAWRDAGAQLFDRVRGGACPGEKLFEREEREVRQQVRWLVEEGEAALRAKLVALRDGERRAAAC